jgi:hypothetical protein
MPANPRYSYSDTTTAIRSVVPEFDLVSPTDFPFLKLIGGGADDKPSLNTLSTPCTATKYEWLELADPALSTTLTADITATAATGVTLATADVPNIVEGMILLIGSEQLLVGATNGANPVPVTRGFAGTTAATAASSSATVTVIGRVHKEGADAPADRTLFPTMPYNYVQEIAATIHASEIEQAISRYGIDDAVEFETRNKSRDLFHLMERGCFYQTRVAPGSGAYPVYGGLRDFIPAANQADKSAGAIATTDVLNLMQTIYGAVGTSGMPTVAVCNAWVRRKLTTIFATTNITSFRPQESKYGGLKVDTVVTDFGELDILLVANCPASDLYLLKPDKLGIGPLAGMDLKREMMAKTGSADKWMIYGAYTFEVRAAKCHGWIKNISTSS